MVPIYSAHQSVAADLEQVNNHIEIDFIGQIDTIRDIQFGSVLHVRIITTVEPGECDPHREAETCPHSRLWIVSGIDVSGLLEPKVWRTERLIGWKILAVQQFERGDVDGLGRAIVSASVCEATQDVESGRVDPRTGGWWHVVPYKLEITKDNVSITREAAGQNAQDCPLN